MYRKSIFQKFHIYSFIILGLTLQTGRASGKSAPTTGHTVQKKRSKKLFRVKFKGLLQNWMTISFDPNEPYSKLGDAYFSFRIRRARLFSVVKVGDIASAKLMIDAARVLEQQLKSLAVTDDTGKEVGSVKVRQAKANSFLIDAFLTIKMHTFLNFSIGQAKIPVSMEGFGSASKLTFLERADVARKFGAKREMGLWFSGGTRLFKYHLGLYNGSGMNRLDGDPQKDLGLRLESEPWKKHLKIALSLYRTLGSTGKMIAGGDLWFAIQNFTLQGEFYWQQVSAGQNKNTDSFGSYITARYGMPVGDYFLEGALRWEIFDPNTAVDYDQYWRLTAGLNLYLVGHKLKVQLNYIHTQAQKKGKDGKIAPANNDAILLGGQIAF